MTEKNTNKAPSSTPKTTPPPISATTTSMAASSTPIVKIIAIVSAVIVAIGGGAVAFKVIGDANETKSVSHSMNESEKHKQNDDYVYSTEYPHNVEENIFVDDDMFNVYEEEVSEDYYEENYETIYDTYDNSEPPVANRLPLYDEIEGYYETPDIGNVSPEDNFYVNSDNKVVILGELVIRPYRLYWQDDSLIAECLIISSNGPVESIELNNLTINNPNGVIASADFGTIEGLSFDNYYAYYTFVFAPETVTEPDADIRYPLLSYSGYYTYC